MLRTDREMALDKVTEICKLAADHYEESAGIVHETDLADLFRNFSRTRYALLDELEEEIRQRGLLPSEPDLDREALDHLFTRVKAAVAKDERRLLLEKCERIEKEGSDRVENALAFEFEGRIPEVLERLRSEIDRSRKELETKMKRNP